MECEKIFNILKAEMKHTKLKVLGISEYRWVGMGHFKSADYSNAERNKTNT